MPEVYDVALTEAKSQQEPTRRPPLRGYFNHTSVVRRCAGGNDIWQTQRSVGCMPL